MNQQFDAAHWAGHRILATLAIQPQTHVRSTQREGWMFAAQEKDENYLREYDRKRNEKWAAEGINRVSRAYHRWCRLTTYNSYKQELRTICQAAGFVPEDGYFTMVFYKHMPKSWRKWKRKLHEWTGNQNKPDLDNYIKAFFDGLMKEDKRIWCHGAVKLWVPDHVEEGIIIVDARNYFTSLVDFLQKKEPAVETAGE